MLRESVAVAFMENQGVVFDAYPEEFQEELPEQMMLYEWEGAVTDEIKQNA